MADAAGIKFPEGENGVVVIRGINGLIPLLYKWPLAQYEYGADQPKPRRCESRKSECYAYHWDACSRTTVAHTGSPYFRKRKPRISQCQGQTYPA